MMTDMLKQDETFTKTRETASMEQFPLVDDIERLFGKAESRLQRITRLQGIAVDGADDVVQETFIEAWRHLAQLRSRERLDAWLDGICRNVCRRHQRQRGILLAREIPLAGTTHDDGDTGAGDCAICATTIPSIRRQNWNVMIWPCC